jgi:type VI protein secretion system component Hcp
MSSEVDMKKFGFLFVLALLAGVPAHANEFMVLTVSGIGCTDTTIPGLANGPGIAVSSWQWGAVTATGANGSKANPTGPATLNSFTIGKPTSFCSAPMLDFNLKGDFAKTVTLTQYTASSGGQPTVSMVVTLSNALIGKYSVTGTTDAPAAESFGFTFSKICVTNKQNNTSYCYSSAP